MASSQGNALPEEERERVAAMVLRYILFKQYGQPDVPVKREELVEVVHRQYPNKRGILKFILPKVQQMAKDTLGYEILQLDAAAAMDVPPGRSGGSQAQSTQTGTQTGKVFVLKSTLKPEVLQKYVTTDHVAQLSGFKLLVCAMIQASGGSITEEELWRGLQKVNLRQTDTSHPEFGRVADVFNQLLRERYIVSRKGVTEDGGETICYELGAQATSLVGKERLLQYFNEVCDCA